MKINKKLLIATIIAGVVAFIANVFLYISQEDSMPQYLLISLMMLVLVLLVGGTILVVAKVSEDTDDEFFFLTGRGPIVIGLVVALVVLVLASMGLEILYDSDIITVSSPTSYIFLLDESSSMKDSDPDFQRNEAVNAMMQTLSPDTPYAVYMFATQTACARPMAPYSQGAYTPDWNLANSVGGGTAIRRGLETVLSDYHAGYFAGGGSNPRVILLSDGEAGDMDLSTSQDILDDYADAGISISTVGLGYDARSLMETIANETGGAYVHIDNAQDLAVSFSKAGRITANRDLFSERNNVSKDLLYGFLRVLFLTILGALIAVIKAMALAKEDSHWLVMIEGVIAAFVGALAVELLLLFEVPMAVGLGIYCVAVAATPAYMPVRTGEYGNRQLYSYY